ncbi:hypothetical protein EH165_07050 [Nakamurella antarctica]|uniref:Uncharacterized protein n=1 Tax=Nakamurella antarctica TaxID=1902245 RepID=A0A3G8ZL10_9ACTN|nr:hypothetical protein [Nakamurella antarctica]AZI57933.1 hypothetical protein EH165_07050 [Nakamurella antarctica]
MEPRGDVTLTPPHLNALPGLIGGRVVLLNSPTVAAWIESFRAWPEGFEFELCVATAAGVVSNNKLGEMDIDFWGHQENTDALFELGVRAAGQEASNTSSLGLPRHHAEAPELSLRPNGGGGGGDHEIGTFWRTSWWLTPLPTTGEVEFWCSWKSGGVPRSAQSIDASRLARAADRSVSLWRESPEA